MATKGASVRKLRHVSSTPFREMRAERGHMSQTFCRAFAATDKSVYNQGVFDGSCTACCCVLRKEGSSEVFYTAHVGNTRAVLSRGGLAVRLTAISDHKPTDFNELSRVHMAGGAVFNGLANGMPAIARALGDYSLKAPFQARDSVSSVPDISTMLLEAQDEFIIMACDGLWDVMTDQDAVNLVRQTFNNNRKMGSAAPDILAHVLVQEALCRGTTDNVTCAVVFPWGLPAPTCGL